MQRVQRLILLLAMVTLWLINVQSEPPSPRLYPGIRTREALLRGSLPPFNTAAEAESRTCALAAASIPDPLPFELYPDDRTVIASYKQAWQTICREGGDASLAEAFRLARQLEEMLLVPVLAEGLPAKEEARRDAIYQRLDALDRFMPAFYGHAEGSGTYGLNRHIFYLFALEAAAEDRSFFQIHFLYRQQAPLYPWQDPGLCTRFGAYDWPKNYATLKEAEETFSQPVYRQALAEWRRALLFEFSGSRERFCLCDGQREDVVLDVENMAVYLAQHPDPEQNAAALEQLSGELRRGLKKVNNFSEEGCSF